MTAATFETAPQSRGEAWREVIKAKTRDIAGAVATQRSITIGERLDSGVFTQIPTRVDSLVGEPETIADINQIARREALKRGDSQLVVTVLERASEKLDGKSSAAGVLASQKLGENPYEIVSAIDTWAEHRDMTAMQSLLERSTEYSYNGTNKISREQIALLAADPTLDVETARDLATKERDGIPTASGNIEAA